MPVVELRTPLQAPITRGPAWDEASPAAPMEIIIVSHVHVSTVAKTRPRYSSETCRRSCDMFRTLLTATEARERAMNSKAHPNVGAWLNST